MTLPDRLAHLPDRKRRELERATQILFGEFDESLNTKLSDKAKRGRILKLILFGSYARGDWVEDRKSGYLSDYDLLVIVNDERFAEQYEAWDKAGERFLQELTITRQLTAPVNFIVHSYQDVNDQLTQGRPFFMDIARDGVVLYEAPGYPLASPRPLAPEEARNQARKYFEHWFPSAARRFEIAQEAIKRGYDKEAAFDLHQATERLYHCVLLVETFYTPHVHNLIFLRKQAERIDRRLVDAWPRETRADRARFEKLKDAYVKARYSKHYRITEEELLWLCGCIEELGQAVHLICTERLAELTAAAERA